MGESVGECKDLVMKLEGKRLLDDPGVNWRIILKCILKKWNRGTDWFDLINDRDRWRVLVNAVMNLRAS
jgi:hypothetical protein